INAIDGNRLSIRERKQSGKARTGLPRWAEENRPTQQMQVRLEPSLVSELERAAKAKGQTKTDWVRDAIRAHLDRTPKPKHN
ncbi:MAG: ribbon-helix-helix protein, CopG family, partial [Rhizobiaceae bacterium]|nr:ribbon-helix-helix protein, CopG family [Rhizobiaceae bacterium]